jgi:Uma2 family endonuclease
MVAQRQHKTFVTPEEYFERERAAEFKSEYLDGEVFAMAGGSPTHSALIFNINAILGPQLRGGPCRGFSSDTKVGSDAAGLYSYPDLSVACGEPQFIGGRQDVLANPVLIVEVLSPSTELFDRGRKFARYQQIESLTDYVLVAQDEPRIEHFARQPDGRWLLTTATGLEGALALPALGITLSLSEVYDRIDFAESGAG